MERPPEKANAPLAKGRREKLTSGGEYSICAHAATRIERMPEGHVHHEAERCAICGRHLDWVAKPENVARRKLLVAYVARLLTVKGLSTWEQGFLKSLSRQTKFSPRQEAVLGRIYRQNFGGAS